VQQTISRATLPNGIELRSLHIADGPVETALGELLAGSVGRLLDVGTGTGRIAELFAPRASHITALDKSPEMLRLARTRLQHLPAGHVTLAQGDFAQLPFADASFDTLLFHQVLHYALAPKPCWPRPRGSRHRAGALSSSISLRTTVRSCARPMRTLASAFPTRKLQRSWSGPGSNRQKIARSRGMNSSSRSGPVSALRVDLRSADFPDW